MMALNTRYRADSDNPRERQAVTEAFASSVLWGFDIAARQGEYRLIDMTDFAERDAMALGPLLAQ